MKKFNNKYFSYIFIELYFLEICLFFVNICFYLFSDYIIWYWPFFFTLRKLSTIYIYSQLFQNATNVHF